MRITVLILVLLLAAGCELEGYEAGPNPINDKRYFLKEVQEGSVVKRTFEYDEENRLVMHRFNNGRWYSYFYDYGDQDHPERLRVFFGDTHRMTIFLKYEDNKLVKSEAYTTSLRTVLFREEYKYDELNRMVNRTVYPGLIGVYTQVEYIWDGNNIVEINAKLPEVTEQFLYEYDDKLNPYIDVFRNVGYNHAESMPITNNNWSKQLYKNSDFDEIESEEKLFSYFVPGYPYYVDSKAEDRYGRKFETGFTYLY